MEKDIFTWYQMYFTLSLRQLLKFAAIKGKTTVGLCKMTFCLLQIICQKILITSHSYAIDLIDKSCLPSLSKKRRRKKPY